MSTEASLRGAFDSYLDRLGAGDVDTAFHGLRELGPSIIDSLIAAYRTELAPQTRTGLLRIISEFRTPLALPLLEEALRAHPAGDWKAALDGLVTLASEDAVRVIESVLDDEDQKVQPDEEFIAWLREALQQTYAAQVDKKGSDPPSQRSS
jgi:hypothetical protein